MLPDLPVLALKLRDYVFWLLPVYGLALAATAGWTALIAVYDPAGYAQARAGLPQGAAASTPIRWLLGRLAGQLTLRPSPAGTALRLWIDTLSLTVTPLALALTAALNPVLALLRLGLGLLLCSLVSAVVAAAGRGGPPRSASAAPRTVQLPRQGSGPPARASLLRVWWAQVQQLLDETGTPLLVSALLGGLVTAWRPATQAAAWLAGLGPAAAIPAALAALLPPWPAGAEVPLARALQTYDVPAVALLPLMLGIPLLNWRRLRQVEATHGRQILLLYLASGLGGVILLGLLAGLVLPPGIWSAF